MRVNRFAVVSLALCMSTTQLVAQEDGDKPRRERDRDRGGERSEGPRGPGRGPGGPGGMGGMMGMFGGMMGSTSGNGATQLLGMLRMDEVRKELGLTDDAFEAVQARQQEAFGKMREMRDATDERRKEITEEIDNEAQELLDEVLPPEKQKRLLGLMVQFARGPAVLNPQVSKELGLSEETSSAIRAELTSFGEKMRDRFMALREGGEFPDFTKIQEELKTARDDLDQLVLAKLTDSQKSQLESLKGEKFEFPEMNMFQGGFGRGNRPPRGDDQSSGGRNRGGRNLD